MHNSSLMDTYIKQGCLSFHDLSENIQRDLVFEHYSRLNTAERSDFLKAESEEILAAIGMGFGQPRGARLLINRAVYRHYSPIVSKLYDWKIRELEDYSNHDGGCDE